MSYIILKKAPKATSKVKNNMDKPAKFKYEPVDIVDSYEEARYLIETDSMLAMSYTSEEISKQYPEDLHINTKNIKPIAMEAYQETNPEDR